MAIRAASLHLGPRDRVIALELRSRRFGFVVFENSKLLDWGLRSCRHGNELASAASKKIARLLDAYRPIFIIVRTRPSRLMLKSVSAKASLSRNLRLEAKKRSITVRAISAKRVRRFFASRGNVTKHAIASKVAECFDELSPRLPPKRKPWQSEHHNTLIFDAAATAIALLGETEHLAPLMAPQLGA